MNNEINITIKKGTFLTVTCPVKTLETDYSTTPPTETLTTKDLTGYTAKMIVKKNVTDTDVNKIFELTGTITTPSNGIVVFQASRTNNNQETGTYYYECVVYSGSGATDYQIVQYGDYVINDNLKQSI